MSEIFKSTVRAAKYFLVRYITIFYISSVGWWTIICILGQDTRIRFSLEPTGGDPGYVQWKDAMKMVARLPEGVPPDFRKKVLSYFTIADPKLYRLRVLLRVAFYSILSAVVNLVRKAFSNSRCWLEEGGEILL